MVKTVLKHGTRKGAALVVIGWLAFVAGNVVQDQKCALILKAVARVLP